MEFYYLFKILYRKKWIILSCVIVAVATAFFLTKNEKKVYKSVSQISTGFTNADMIKLTDDRFNTQQIDVKFSNVIENITSPKVLQLLSYDLALHDLTSKTPFKSLTVEEKLSPTYRDINKTKTISLLREKLSSMKMLGAADPEDSKVLDVIRLYGYTIDALHNNLEVERYQRTDYINISFKSENPELSAYVVNNLITQFNRYYYHDKRSLTDSSIVNLDSIVKQKKAILDAKTLEKTNYMSSQNIVDVGVQGTSTLQQISNFETQLAQEQGTQQELGFKITQIESQIRDAQTKLGSASQSTTSISPENNEYLSLRKQYNDIYKEYDQKGKSDANLKKQLEEISNKMQKLRLAYDNTATPKATPTVSVEDLIQKKLDAEGELRASTARIDIIQAKIAELRGGLNGIAVQGADMSKLEKEIEFASNDYTAAKEKLTIAMNMNNEGPNTIKQTLVGQPAFQPEPSKRNIIITLAGAAAFILSCVVFIFLEYLDQSIKTPSQFQRLTHLPLLGAVNYVDINRKNILENVNHVKKEEHNRDNTFRELLRKLRFEIETSNKRIFLFTSTEPGQGKTTLIQALAYSLSLGKKKVLIIDTNFCNNDLTKDLSASPVLEKFHVNGKPFTLNDAAALITKTKVEGVDMIGCGEGDYTPSEILPKNHLLNYLNELLKVYDYIFLEGAPLNNFTDTKELIHYSDGLVAIFSSETSLTPIDKESIKFLKQQDKKFVGAILNKVQLANLEM